MTLKFKHTFMVSLSSIASPYVAPSSTSSSTSNSTSSSASSSTSSNISSESTSQTRESQHPLVTLFKRRGFWAARETAAALKNVSAVDLRQVIETLCTDIAAGTWDEDPLAVCQRIVERIPLEQLQAAVKEKYPSAENAATAAVAMLEEARHFLQVSEKQGSSTIQALLSTICDSVISIIESLLSTFGIHEFLRPPENEFEANLKAQKVMNLLTFFSVLTSTLLPLVGIAPSMLILGATLLFLSVLSFLYPYCRPMPSMLPRAENISRQVRQVRQGTHLLTDGRKHYVDQIAQTLIASKTTNAHPLLVGKSGIGKNELVKALAAAIDENVYPELAGKHVFYIATADLCQNTKQFGGPARLLAKISEAMGRHRDRFILVFDKIHLAADTSHPALCEHLKILLGPAAGNFPYVIGLTNENDYAQHILPNTSFDRHFTRINITNTSDEETLEILHNTLIRQAPSLLVEPGALQYLIAKTKEAFRDLPQPGNSIRILSKCIQLSCDMQRIPLVETITRIQREIHTRSVQDWHSGHARTTEQEDVITRLEEQLRGLQKQLRENLPRYRSFFKIRNNFARVKNAMYREVYAASLSAARVLHGSRAKHLAAFQLMHRFLLPAMEAEIRRTAGNLELQAVLNNELVNSALLQSTAPSLHSAQ